MITGPTGQRIIGALLLTLVFSALVIILNWTYYQQDQSQSLDLTAKTRQIGHNAREVTNRQINNDSPFVINEQKMNEFAKDHGDSTVQRQHKAISSEDLATGDDSHRGQPHNEQPKHAKQFRPNQNANVDDKVRAKQQHKPTSKWAIQLATFANSNNAEQLVHKLQQQGWDAYQSQHGQYTLVYVGPLTDKNEARQYKKTLRAKLQLVGVVKSYDQ
jgi:cell division septation protein DedD